MYFGRQNSAAGLLKSRFVSPTAPSLTLGSAHSGRQNKSSCAKTAGGRSIFSSLLSATCRDSRKGTRGGGRSFAFSFPFFHRDVVSVLVVFFEPTSRESSFPFFPQPAPTHPGCRHHHPIPNPFHPFPCSAKASLGRPGLVFPRDQGIGRFACLKQSGGGGLVRALL